MSPHVLVRVVGVLAVLGGGIGTLWPPGADAQASVEYSLRARADTVGVQLIAVEAPIASIGGGEVLFATPASAQSEVDSLGSSRAFAGAPYPGDLIVSLPGTAAGLLGQVDFPVPSYPAYVASSHPTEPERSETVGPYGISAVSADDASRSEARIGLSTSPPHVVSTTASSSVRRDPESGRLVAESVSEIAPLALSNLLRIGDIRSTARVELDPDDPEAVPITHTSLSIGTITVAGIEVGLTEQGLSVAGETLLPVDLGALTSLLAGAGLQVEYVPATETPTSIVSAALRITYQREVDGLGLTTVRLVLGQVSASAEIGGAVAPQPPGPTDTTVPEPAPVSVPAPPPPPAEVADVPSPPPSEPRTEQAAPPAARRVETIESVPAGHLPIPGPDLWSFFPALGAGGLVALATSRSGPRTRTRGMTG